MVDGTENDIKPNGNYSSDNNLLIDCKNVDVFYGDKQALYNVSLGINEKEVTSLIGPSGCGKSTFLRCLNRMNDVIDSCSISGNIKINGEDIYNPHIDVVELRSRIGMVFKKPNPFPKSVFDNVAYGPRLHGKLLIKMRCIIK